MDKQLVKDIGEEIFAHMRMTGSIDGLTMTFQDHFLNTDEYAKIIKDFRDKMQTQFLSRANLADPRDKLRKDMRKQFDLDSSFGQKLSDGITKVMKEKRQEYRKLYEKETWQYLEKYIKVDPEPVSESETPTASQHEPQVEIKLEPQVELQPERRLEPQIKHEPQPQLQPLPQLPTQLPTQLQPQPQPEPQIKTEPQPQPEPEPEPELEPQPEFHLEPEPMELESPSDSPVPPPYSPLDTPPEEVVSLSPVSSVCTGDLSDYDDTLPLFTDEQLYFDGKEKTKVEEVREKVAGTSAQPGDQAQTTRRSSKREIKLNSKYLSGDFTK